MLGGYCIKYAIANLGDLFHAGWGVGDADSGEFFSAFYGDQLQTAIFTVIFCPAHCINRKGRRVRRH